MSFPKETPIDKRRTRVAFVKAPQNFLGVVCANTVRDKHFNKKAFAENEFTANALLFNINV